VKQHPEQQDGELYMGNIEEMQFGKSSWLSSRMGAAAYDIDGNVISKSFGNLRPWFIRAEEVESAIRAEEISPRPWSAEKIAIYRKMLAEASNAQ